MKPSPKTIFVGSRSETGSETEPQNDLFEAGLKPGVKPQNSNQGETDYWYETAKLKPSRLWYETDYETGMKPKGGANLNSLRHLPLCTKPPLDRFFRFRYETDYETGMKPKGGANLNSLRHLPLCTKPHLDHIFQFNYEADYETAMKPV